MLFHDRKYCDLVNLWKRMDGSVLKYSMCSQDRQNLFTRIASMDFKIVSCNSKGYKDLKNLSDEDLEPRKCRS